MPKRLYNKNDPPDQIIESLCGHTDDLGMCLIWRGALATDGYPVLFGNKKVHRFIWELKHGESAKGRVVRHKCDCITCISPDHLEIGTIQDNMHDKFVRNRQPRVITKEIVFKVRELLTTTTMKNIEIAQMLGINRRRVSDIKNGRYNEAGKIVRQGE